MLEILRIVPVGWGLRCIMLYLSTVSIKNMLEKGHNPRQVKDPPTSNSHKAAQVYVHHWRDVVKILLPKGSVGSDCKACLCHWRQQHDDKLSQNLHCWWECRSVSALQWFCLQQHQFVFYLSGHSCTPRPRRPGQVKISQSCPASLGLTRGQWHYILPFWITWR